MSQELLLTDNEMKGLLQTVEHGILQTDPKEVERQKVHAVVDLFFTKVLNPDMPYESSQKQIMTLQKLIDLALESDESPKQLVFRVRKRYFDAIVSGEKTTEFRPDSLFWRSRIDGKGKEGEPEWIAVFICGKRVHRRVITLIQKVDTPSWFSEQGRKDVSTPQCYAIHLGVEVK